MHNPFVIRNAQLVLPDGVIEGWLAVEGGRITEIGEGSAPERGIDAEGDFIIPGLVELHTDNLESHLKPRPKVNWPRRSAVIAYDLQLACSGITTVFDSLRIGSDADYAPDASEVPELMEEISEAGQLGLLRIDHRTHLRCEICAHDVLVSAAAVMSKYTVDLISLMDHTPGARQFVSIDAWKTYYGGKSGLAAHELDALMARKHAAYVANYSRHREALVAMAHAKNVAIASHDDSTGEHVEESLQDQVVVAEFPTTIEAAKLSHDASIAVLMGAPNVVRGGSHSGNVAAEALAREGVLDILSSDYVPASLLMGAFALADRVKGYGLARAIRTVTLNPARACGLMDRGAIDKGQIADLVRVRRVQSLAAVREVYKNGTRIV
jgi:alpha-D-ribose 1-methylphosphonate 5-triphosphate diphosphatase